LAIYPFIPAYEPLIVHYFSEKWSVWRRWK